VLLDEIGDMPLDMQAKLLRVLQEKMVQRLGGVRNIPIRARVIASTHHDLDEAIAQGRFRLDLFHRLRVVHLRLPPLRERREDIELLAIHHLERHAQRLGRKPVRLAPNVLLAFQVYSWPGNVRELANVVEGAASLLPPGQDVIDRVPATIERALHEHAQASTSSATPSPVAGYSSGSAEIVPFRELERRAVEQALAHFSGNVALAAKALGVAKGTVYNKIKEYNLSMRRYGDH
jgi:two-component system response regulator HydG